MVDERNMKDYTGAILIEEPFTATGLQTFKVEYASNLKPGYACTTHGASAGYIRAPDGADEQCVGIVLDNADLDIDAYFAAGKTVTVAMKGSQAVAWAYNNTQDVLYVGQPMKHNATNGYLTVGEEVNEYIGYAIEQTAADTGYYNPFKLRLG